jgi:drug/metabolite transporter (DMT)-like permease
MSLEVMLVVLLSALLHAGWNALVRSAADKFQSTLLVVCGAGALSLMLLPFLPVPAAPSWPYIATSGLIHVVYFTLVALAYRHADLGFVYPVMRGTAPALAALAALFVLQESPPAMGWLGIGLICTGVLLLSGAVWHAGMIHPASVAFAVGNACVIAIYTLVDGQGVRLSGHAVSYTGWVFLLTALLMLGVAATVRGRAALQPGAGAGRTALLGGLGTLLAYSLVLWAMTRAPIASVAALRETSIIFAALIGVLFLKEQVSRLRLASVMLVFAGAAAIKLA